VAIASDYADWVRSINDRVSDVVRGPDPGDESDTVVHVTGEGKKYDAGKPPVSLIPREAIEAMARVLAFGAQKYGRWNWRQGMAWSRVIDACLRHLIAYADGEDCDPETGESHMAHVLACAAFLVTYRARGIGSDDRHTGTEVTE